MTHWGEHVTRGRTGGMARWLANRASAVAKARTIAPEMRCLPRKIISGFNILSLAGFVLMALTLALSRSGQTGKALSIALMSAGTALVFFGLYAGSGSR